MNTNTIKQNESTYEIEVYSKRDIALVRGVGVHVWDSDGKKYIDCTSGVGVANIGHSNEKLASRIAEQSQMLITCYGIYYNDQRSELLKRLADVSPKNICRSFLCNSGSEAVEAAIKFARASTGKHEVIAFMRGFHGKTLGSLAATWNPKHRDVFAPMMAGFKHVPVNKIEKINEAVSNDTAAVLLELVQGEGGVRLLEKEFVLQVASLCRKKDILLIIDEVQTGFGRTGRFFCSEYFGIEPDIICCGKSIAGGLPMGATLCSDKIHIPRNSHTTTFGGSPLVCAAANATIEIIQEQKLSKRAAENGQYFLEKLSSIHSDKIIDIRGLGLMLAVELTIKAGKIIQKMSDKGVLALLAGPKVVRFLPPLIIKKAEIDEVVEILSNVLCND